ncbi:MAG: hypothetical protein ABI986_08015, partial [Chloroflexota bacterium]
MSKISNKIFLACLLVLVVLTTGIWQNDQVAQAAGRNASAPETPLYPGLTWSNPSLSNRNIRLNVKGDSIFLSGESYVAVQQFSSAIPQDVLNYYSNGQLAKYGWASFDAFENTDGVHFVFYHEAGVYLSVEFEKCTSTPSNTCITVWKSEQTKTTATAAATIPEPDQIVTASTFGKTSPANGTTNLDPASIVLKWGTYSPTPDKYSYCVKEGSACDASDPNWTGTNLSTSVTLTNLTLGKTYYWQVKAITCSSCTPKTVVYADNGTAWTFKTKQNQVTIVGNAGIAGAVLSYTDG